jgi:hypothetical protein
MPAFLAPLIGAAGGVVLGYTLDHFFGDSDYTGREMFVDSATGALGGGLIRPLTSVGTRFGKVVRHYGDDAYKVGASGVDDLIVAGYITAPMISRPARMEFIGGAVAGLVYDIAHSKSPDVRSEQNASDVTSGGKSLEIEPASKVFSGLYPTSRNYSCPPGYQLVKYRGKWMCRKKGSKLGVRHPSS